MARSIRLEYVETGVYRAGAYTIRKSERGFWIVSPTVEYGNHVARADTLAKACDALLEYVQGGCR